MFPSKVDSYGRPLTLEWAKNHARWEKVVEITQMKGDSETHPKFSPNDEFADFETMDNSLDTRKGTDRKAGAYIRGNYIRQALGMGLEHEAKLGVNPFKLGVIGSTDTHTAMASTEEFNATGKSMIDTVPNEKKKDLIHGMNGYNMSSSGLAAAWATGNTRQEIFDAYQRREVYGTSGTFMKVRMFGGFNFNENDLNAKDIAEVGYNKGVPMGGDLTNAPAGKAPTFMITADKDPMSANLDRIQVVKVWLNNETGISEEKVFNAAWSGDRKLDANGKIAPIGNTVDLKTGRYTNTIGDAQLATVWSDPEFDPKQKALYYARVLEIPTPRNSTLNAIALNDEFPKEHAKVIQERAYTSSIWYTPAK